MRVTVRVVGHAVEYFPEKRDHYELEFDGPVSIAQVVNRIGVNRVFVMAAIVDGERRDLSYELTDDGVEVVLMTPPAGG